ncbi:MAG TPA: hypothetical protein VFN08_14845, partial [Gemmatimonadales bacterium]|nr:hypothetical protein [Gemmatimonadales bacterium]
MGHSWLGRWRDDPRLDESDGEKVARAAGGQRTDGWPGRRLDRRTWGLVWTGGTGGPAERGDRQTGKPADRWTGGPVDRWTGGPVDRWTG